MAKKFFWNNDRNLPVAVSAKPNVFASENSTPNSFEKTIERRFAGKNGFGFEKVSFKVSINKVERPFSSNLDNELDWICNCFGFEKDKKESSPNALFKEIVKSFENKKPHTSTSLAKKMNISRGAVINHLHNLLRAGLIARNGRFYVPRSNSMFRTINEIEEDVERLFNKMKESAKKIDRQFGIEAEE